MLGEGFAWIGGSYKPVKLDQCDGYSDNFDYLTIYLSLQIIMALSGEDCPNCSSRQIINLRRDNSRLKVKWFNFFMMGGKFKVCSGKRRGKFS